MPLCDWEIIDLVKNSQLIEEFREDSLNPFGYDLVLAEDFLIPIRTEVPVDPLKVNESYYRKYIGKSCIIPPGDYILGRSIERIKIPRNIVGLCTGRSSYARCGILINVTPLEAGWTGKLTIEISNEGASPVIVHAGRGITQIRYKFRSLESDQ